MVIDDVQLPSNGTSWGYGHRLAPVPMNCNCQSNAPRIDAPSGVTYAHNDTFPSELDESEPEIRVSAVSFDVSLYAPLMSVSCC